MCRAHSPDKCSQGRDVLPSFDSLELRHPGRRLKSLVIVPFWKDYEHRTPTPEQAISLSLAPCIGIVFLRPRGKTVSSIPRPVCMSQIDFSEGLGLPAESLEDELMNTERSKALLQATR